MKAYKKELQTLELHQDQAREMEAVGSNESGWPVNPTEKAVEKTVEEAQLWALHPTCPDPGDCFQPLTDFLTLALTKLVERYLKVLGRGVDIRYWRNITQRILSAPKSGIQVIPAQAGAGKSTWIQAFLMALCKFQEKYPKEAQALGGVLLVIQKVETLNEFQTKIRQELGKEAAAQMVPLQSLTPSGKALGLCPNPAVTDYTQCTDRCAYAGECPLKALEGTSRGAYILGVTQARFYALRQNGLLDQLLLREREEDRPVPRRWIIFDEKPELFQIDALSTGILNGLSNRFESLVTQKRLSDQKACRIQSSLGVHIGKPLQELRRSTVIPIPGQPPKDELAGLCTLSPKGGERKDYVKFRVGLQSRQDLMNGELRSCFQVMDRLYAGEECLFCKACGFHVITVQDGMQELRGRQTLIFDATAPVDGDYQRQTSMQMLPSQALRNTQQVTFHIYLSKQLNVSKNGMKRQGMIHGLCALIEEMLEEYPQPTFLCVYKEYSGFFAQHLSAAARQYIQFMPGQDPPKTPYFGGTNGSSDFRQCRNVILLGYPRLNPEVYLERTYAAWGESGFREELQQVQERMRHQRKPWADGLRSLPSVAEYEARHLAARMEQEIYRCALRNAQVSGPIHVFLLHPPEPMWKLLNDRFPGCQVEYIKEVPLCMLSYLGSDRTYKGKKTALSSMQEFLANWDGTSVKISQLRQQLNISSSAWKELQAQERFRGMLLHCRAELVGRGKNAMLRRRADDQKQIPA